MSGLRSGSLYASLTALALLAAGLPAGAQILTENFNGVPSGGNFLTYGVGASVGSFTVGAGSVDVVAQGVLAPADAGRGNYVDLDGNTSGRLDSGSLSLLGGTVTLQFLLAGSQRGDTNTVRVSLGSLFTKDYTQASADPFTLQTEVITVPTSQTAVLRFDHTVTAGNALGLLLDDVVLRQTTTSGAAIPEPGTVALFAVGLLPLASALRPRRKR